MLPEPKLNGKGRVDTRRSIGRHTGARRPPRQTPWESAGAPPPDLLLIANMVTMERLKREGRLMARPDAPVSAYDPMLYAATLLARHLPPGVLPWED